MVARLTEAAAKPDAKIKGYHQLLAALRSRKAALGMSDKDLEHIAGLTPGHWSKIVAGSKVFGQLSLGRVLRALAIDLVVAEDAVAAAQLSELYLPRAESQVRKTSVHTSAVHVKISRRFLRKIGALGGANSRRNLGKRKRRQLARKAAAARWAKQREKRTARPSVR